MKNKLSERYCLSEAVLGCSDKHVDYINDYVCLHADVVTPWLNLCEAAAEAGFDLQLASGYRSFERQKMIWNQKLLGQRPVFDDSGEALALSDYTPLERVRKVLRWSALPGASRHHWGTDIDIYDRAAIDEKYQLQLSIDEYTDGGPFAAMIYWLKDYLLKGNRGSQGFVFPYTEDRGGVMPEPWHLSYLPVAQQFQEQWSVGLLLNHWRGGNIMEQAVIEQNFDLLYESYIKNTITPFM